MDVKDYCSGLQCELTGWKAKIYDVVRRIDKMSSADKDKVSPDINALHGIIDAITEKVEWLNKECPIDYENYKKDLENKVIELKSKWEDVLEDASPV